MNHNYIIWYDDTTYGAAVRKISKIEKLKMQFKQHPVPKDLTFHDLRTLLEHYGCTFYNDNGGSHYTISTPHEKYPTTFSDHGILKNYQIKLALKILDELESEHKK